MNDDIEIFENGELRRVWIEASEEWFFAIIDVIAVLTDSSNPRRYWSDLKRKLKKEGADQLYEKIVQLKLKANDGRMRETDVANVETLLRIIQSVPSPKAEPFKQWLAQVGNERLEEIEDPSVALERIRNEYRQRGYDEDWIEKRIQSIVTRNELTDEWEARGVKVGKEYAILTSIISRETFGLTPSQHKKLKALKRENLRDHMTTAELVFTMLGEVSTTEITRNDDAQGFDQNKLAARKGGRIAGNARQALEAETGRSVLSETNYLEKPQQEQLEEPKTDDDDDLPF